jgi:hypothetical protein
MCSSNDLLLVAIKPKANVDYAAAILLFLLSIKKTQRKLYVIHLFIARMVSEHYPIRNDAPTSEVGVFDTFLIMI